MRQFGSWLALSLLIACYSGDVRDKEPPPGYPGGFCLMPDGWCEQGTCNRNKNYCYEPNDPCEGFSCGGEDRGTCMIGGDLLPVCMCNVGYANEPFEQFCCPIDGSDPRCTDGGDGGMPGDGGMSGDEGMSVEDSGSGSAGDTGM